MPDMGENLVLAVCSEDWLVRCSEEKDSSPVNHAGTERVGVDDNSRPDEHGDAEVHVQAESCMQCTRMIVGKRDHV